MLLASEAHDNTLGLCQFLVDGQRSCVVRVARRVEHLEEQEVTLGATAQTANTGYLGQLCQDAVTLGENLGTVVAHDCQALLGDGVGCEGASRTGDVVGGFEAVEEAGNRGGGEGGTETDAGQAKGLGQGLHDNKVGELRHPLGEGRIFRSKVDVGLIEDHDAVPCGVVEDLLDIRLCEDRAGGVARRANVHKLDVRLVGERVEDLRDIERERRGRQQGDLDDGDVVDLGRHGVHAVGGRAGEDAVAAGHAEAAQQGVDGLVTADSDEEVIGRERLRSVGVRVAQGAKLLLQIGLVGVGIAVQAEEVDVEAAAGSRGNIGAKRRPKGVLVGVKKNVGAVVLVVAVAVGQSVWFSRGRYQSGGGATCSLAQRYGWRARILGRAQASRLKGDIVTSDVSLGSVNWVELVTGWLRMLGRLKPARLPPS